MSFMKTNDLERHEMMFREKRLTEKRRYSGSDSQQNNNQKRNNSGLIGGYYNTFQDIISFNGFKFVYDKQFRNPLKQLTNELKIFVTIESKNKSRNITQNMPILANCLSFGKKELIQSIKYYIKCIEELDKIDRRDANNEMNVFTQTHIFSQTFKSTPILFNINNDSSESEDQNTSEYDYGYEENEGFIEKYKIKDTKLHTKQFIESLDDPNSYRYSDRDSIWSPELSSSSGYESENVCRSPPLDSQQIPKSQQKPESQQIPDSQRRQYSQKTQKSQQISETQQTFPQNKITTFGQLLQIINRHKWSNTEYCLSKGITLKVMPENKVRTQKKRRKQLKFVLEKILGLIENDTFCTKRDLYYQNVGAFNGSQRVVDEIIDDLACSLRVSRTKLHIVSSTRGLVYGHLKFRNTNGFLTDCLSSPNGINIPNDTEKLTQMESNAIFVLIVEKDATFQQLIDLKIHLKFPLIMVTAHGYPDLNSRAFIQILWNTFEIPIFGLVDGDAHGLEILCTFRHGSLALSYESPNLVTPAVKWLGILPTDICEYRLSGAVQIKLSETDIKKIEDLKQRPYMKTNKDWTKQLDILLKFGKKVEIQSLAQHWPTFLLDVYLPAKIRYGKWL